MNKNIKRNTSLKNKSNIKNHFLKKIKKLA